MVSCKLSQHGPAIGRNGVSSSQRGNSRRCPASELFNVNPLKMAPVFERACCCFASETGTRPIVELQTSSALLVALLFVSVALRCVFAAGTAYSSRQYCNTKVFSFCLGSFRVRLGFSPACLARAEGPVGTTSVVHTPCGASGNTPRRMQKILSGYLSLVEESTSSGSWGH